MDALTALTTRRSQRRYQARAVPRLLLEKAIDAGRLAPTANNLQPWEFVVATEPERLRQLSETTDHGRFIATAAACVVVLSRDTKYFLEDGSAAVVNILTALHAQGLAACWVAGDKKPYARRILDLVAAPADWKLVALIPCGFPAGPAPTLAKRGLDEVLHWEQLRG